MRNPQLRPARRVEGLARSTVMVTHRQRNAIDLLLHVDRTHQ